MSPNSALAPRFRPARKRAIGVIRVSEVGDREGEAFRSPDIQRSIIQQACTAHDYNLLLILEEIDVSGYSIKEVNKRKGLGPAVAMIEAGEADILILPYLDRLAREVTVYRKAMQRIRAVGGEVLAVDFGDVTGRTAVQRFSVEQLIHVAELFAEMTAEKTNEAKKKAIAAGIPTFDRIPFGYRKDPHTRRLVAVPDEAEAVKHAFHLREADATLEAIRDFLRTTSPRRFDTRAVQNLLKQRMYLGELRFGNLVNLHAHEAIIDPGLFRTVQGKRVSRTKKRMSSELLLARLGVARCGSCGNALVAGSQWQTRATGERRRYDDYRCSNMGDCAERVHITARVLDEAVVRYLARLEAEGHASVDEELEAAELAYQHAEQQLSTMIALLDGTGDLVATQKKLAEFKARREETFGHWQSLRALRGTSLIRASDWQRLTLSEQRALIRSRIRSISVARSPSTAHVPDRIRIEPFTQ